MLGSAAMPAFPLDYEAGPGIKLSRKGARFRFDLRNPAIPTTGSLNAYAVTTPSGIGALEAGINVLVEADRTNTGPCFLNVDGTGPLPWLDAGSAEQGAGRIIAGRYYLCFFDADLVAWKILAGATTLDEIPGFSAGVQAVQTGAAQVAQDAAAVASNAQTVATQVGQVATQAAQVATDAGAAAAASALAGAARDQAVANAVAGSLRFPTRAALLAFVPADPAKLYYADVDQDAGRNGRYLWNGAAPWTLVSSTTLNALNDRTAILEGVIDPGGYLGADLATFVDGLQRIIGSIGADATWQILQDALRLKGGSILLPYDTLSGEHIAVTDAAGNKVPVGILLDKVRLPGGLTIEHYETLDPAAPAIAFADERRQQLPVDLGGGSSAVTAEVAAARGTRTALADRLGTSLTPYGMPRDYRWGTHYLRETRERLMALQCGAARRLTVALIGDSWTQVKPYWSAAFVKALVAAYGDGGFGWTGFTSTGGGIVGNARPDLVQVARTGTWTDVTWTRPGPDLCSTTSTAAGSRVTVTGPGTPALSGCDLYYYGTSDGQARYRWNGGAWTTIALTGSGLAIAPVTAGLPGSGAFTFDIEVVSGTVSLDGINLKSSTSGVVVHNIACSGSRLSHHVAVDATQYQAGIAGLAPDLVVPLLGTNDQTNSTPTAFAANYGTLIGRLRAARPLADLLMVMPAENLRGYTGDPMSGYAAAAYPVAQQQRCAWIDLQYVFGDQPSEYGSTSARPWIDPDNIHPQAGYFPISSAVFRTLAYS